MKKIKREIENLNKYSEMLKGKRKELDKSVYRKEIRACLDRLKEQKGLLADMMIMEIKICCPKLESIYEDVIVSIVGEDGLLHLRATNRIESCGVIKGFKLYTIK